MQNIATGLGIDEKGIWVGGRLKNILLRCGLLYAGLRAGSCAARWRRRQEDERTRERKRVGEIPPVLERGSRRGFWRRVATQSSPPPGPRASPRPLWSRRTGLSGFRMSAAVLLTAAPVSWVVGAKWLGAVLCFRFALPLAIALRDNARHAPTAGWHGCPKCGNSNSLSGAGADGRARG
jgi:hypothetical protein